MQCAAAPKYSSWTASPPRSAAPGLRFASRHCRWSACCTSRPAGSTTGRCARSFQARLDRLAYRRARRLLVASDSLADERARLVNPPSGSGSCRRGPRRGRGRWAPPGRLAPGTTRRVSVRRQLARAQGHRALARSIRGHRRRRGDAASGRRHAGRADVCAAGAGPAGAAGSAAPRRRPRAAEPG